MTTQIHEINNPLVHGLYEALEEEGLFPTVAEHPKTDTDAIIFVTSHQQALVVKESGVEIMNMGSGKPFALQPVDITQPDAIEQIIKFITEE